MLTLELQFKHSEGWATGSYPEWLLFELEQNLFIRPKQAQIALQMLTSTESICSQLQMGEGKTSVILPIVCAIVSDSTKVMRVNVIPSLLHTSVSYLSGK